MHGTQEIGFNQLIGDTIRAHGIAWAHAYYTKRGMLAWEFRFWARLVY